jgi:hypothetical protein
LDHVSEETFAVIHFVFSVVLLGSVFWGSGLSLSRRCCTMKDLTPKNDPKKQASRLGEWQAIPIFYR